MPTLEVAPAKIERVAKALCANDYLQGPNLWEPESIEARWVQLHPDDTQHYLKLAAAAVTEMQSWPEARDFAQGEWLAGFVAGEGCFGIYQSHGGYMPRFTIALRVDDEPVLLGIQRSFGGHVSRRRVSSNPLSQNPISNLIIGAKDGLQKLVAYFDENPLVARKGREFGIWRTAVELYVREGCMADGLGDLADELREMRSIDLADAIEEFEAASV